MAFFNGNVPPGYSYSQQTVTARSSVGSVNFVVTTAINRLPNGSIAELPLVQLQSPAPENRSLSGRSGTTLPGAVAIQVGVQSGPQSGAPVPNVGMRIVDYNDPTVQPAAQCANRPLTDANGIARCDLLLTGSPGTYLLSAEVGEFRLTPGIFVTISPAAACTYSVAASSQQFQPGSAIGTLSITAPGGCAWNAISSASWISIPASSASGSGSGSTPFSIAANPGTPRSAVINLGGQAITVNQAGGGSLGGSQALAIVTGANLPSAVVGSSYNVSLTASGGKPPYSWSSNVVLPAGLTLNPSTGVISGTPSITGSYPLPVNVTDQGGSSLGQTFSLSVVASGQPGGQPGGAPAVTNTGFPDAALGMAYQQVLTSVGGCASPFSAPPTYVLTGGNLPPGLIITKIDDRRYAIAGTPTSAGASNFSITVTDPCSHSGTSNFSLTVAGAGTGTGGGGGFLPVAVTVNPSSISFASAAGQLGGPADQTVTIAGPAGAAFSASASAATGGNWLSLSPVSGSLPATLTVRASNPGALSAGTYMGTVTVATAAGSLAIPVTLTISGPAIALAASQPAILSTAQVGSAPVEQSLDISVPAGTTHFTALVSTANGGSWLSVDRISGDTPANLKVRLNPAGLQPALYTGAIQIVPSTPSASPLSIPVTLRVLSAPAFALSAAYLSFVNSPGQLPGPQILTVASSGLPVDGAVVATTVSGGSWLRATPSSNSTPFTVEVAVNTTGLSAGTYQGAVVVTSGTQSVAPVSVPVTLLVQQSAPVISAIVNAANFRSGALSPGEIVTIFGFNIGPPALAGSRLDPRGALDSNVGDTRVLFDNIPAPLIYSVDQQISAIVPYELAGKSTTRVQVEYRGVRSIPMEFAIALSAPALFTTSASGQGPAAALNEDGSYNSQSSGAEPGSIITLYATGEGATTPDGVDGLLAISVYPTPVLPVRVTLGNQDGEVLYAGAAPQLAAGLMQLNVRLPTTLPRG
ncbi:MAG: putative Ig domain-containing protein, partial [Actinomycetota bacterium]|nr:putative Ig domain-containing protein [Actinomycetota bacterium]